VGAARPGTHAGLVASPRTPLRCRPSSNRCPVRLDDRTDHHAHPAPERPGDRRQLRIAECHRRDPARRRRPDRRSLGPRVRWPSVNGAWHSSRRESRASLVNMLPHHGEVPQPVECLQQDDRADRCPADPAASRVWDIKPVAPAPHQAWYAAEPQLIPRHAQDARAQVPAFSTKGNAGPSDAGTAGPNWSF
jgi:hypothetical protein